MTTIPVPLNGSWMQWAARPVSKCAMLRAVARATRASSTSSRREMMQASPLQSSKRLVRSAVAEQPPLLSSSLHHLTSAPQHVQAGAVCPKLSYCAPEEEASGDCQQWGAPYLYADPADTEWPYGCTVSRSTATSCSQQPSDPQKRRLCPCGASSDLPFLTAAPPHQLRPPKLVPRAHYIGTRPTSFEYPWVQPFRGKMCDLNFWNVPVSIDQVLTFSFPPVISVATTSTGLAPLCMAPSYRFLFSGCPSGNAVSNATNHGTRTVAQCRGLCTRQSSCAAFEVEGCNLDVAVDASMLGCSGLCRTLAASLDDRMERVVLREFAAQLEHGKCQYAGTQCAWRLLQLRLLQLRTANAAACEPPHPPARCTCKCHHRHMRR